MPLENIEVIEEIKKNENNLELIKLDTIFDANENQDFLFIIIDYKNKIAKVFLKGKISTKKFQKIYPFPKTQKKKLHKY